MERTALPFSVDGDYICDAFGTRRAKLENGFQKDNAEDILKAVNSHEKLLEACKIALKVMGQVGLPLVSHYEIQQLKQAIAEVGGE